MSTTFGPEVGPSFDSPQPQQLPPRQEGTFGTEENPAISMPPTEGAISITDEYETPASRRAAMERGVTLPEDVRVGKGLSGLSNEQVTQLVARAQRGGEDGGEAMATLFFDHASRLASSVLSSVPYHERQDILQMAATKAYRMAGKFEINPSTLSAWFSAVTRNCMIDEKRKRDALMRPDLIFCSDDNQEGGVFWGAKSTENLEEETVNRLIIEEAIGRLSADHQEVVRDVYMQGKTVNEFAQKAEIVPGTVKSRGYYALRKLKRDLRDSDF